LRYSAFKLLIEGLRGQSGWKPVWRDPEPQTEYDYIIVGGGGHGLATAHYLAKIYKKSRIAVLEKGWIGGVATPRHYTVPWGYALR
jgi:sarcosine oxidase subunit beta|tara:strand:- start:7176 stop:7433 length:258 start_codon:yes stop_codon:yes gene_type:complete